MSQAKSEEHFRQNRRIVKPRSRTYIRLATVAQKIKRRIRFFVEWARLSIIESKEIHRRMRLQRNKKARGICPWCSEMITKKQAAYKTCDECPHFDKPYIHVGCAITGVCSECDYGLLRKCDRVQ